jgi:glycerate kinase
MNREAHQIRVLCAPDKFKGTLSAADVAEAMARGARSVGANIAAECLPVADGGEGTLDALIAGLGGRIEQATVTGPLGDPVEARFGITADRTGIVELAEASGLQLVPPARRGPLQTTTYGTGQLIRIAADRGCTEVVVGVGGSATCDGGLGLAQALGAHLYDFSGGEIEAPFVGGMLRAVANIDPPPDLLPIRVACDVTNPLCGRNGAAFVYGPQKGASIAEVALLDAGLRHLASLVGDDPETPGAGAAGGAGFGLLALCGARLMRGVDLVLDALKFMDHVQHAALVLTGEGRLDGQTGAGKAVAGVAQAAHIAGVPVAAVVGARAGPVEGMLGGQLWRTVSLSARFGEELARAQPAILIEAVVAEMVAEALAHE